MKSVAISNGEEFYRIEPADLPSAEQDGFYRPIQHGLTIVGNRQHLFEIPISDVPAAKQGGYRDLLEKEREPAEQADARRPPRIKKLAATAGAAVSGIGGPGDNVLLVDELTKAEHEAEEARRQAEQELAAAEGWRWYALSARMWFDARHDFLLRHFRSNSVSIVVHVAVFLLLASLVLVSEEEPEVMLTASTVTSDVVQEIIIEPEPLEITEPTETEESEAPPEAAEIETPMTEAVTPDFLAAVSGDAIKPPAMPAKETGDGKEMPTKKSAVFGTKRSATDYVFVIDNSNSMTKGRFETALNELAVAINDLTPKQRFYVIFYSDTAYPMMHPRPVTQMVPATSSNKQQLYYWLQSVQLCLKTNGKEAIQAAFNMKPDVIYVLGDGAFTDGAAKHFANMPRTKTVLHTRGMEVSPQNAKEFERLAKSHGGDYKDVGVSPIGAQMAKRNPRPRNNSRTPVWGITLPSKKK